MFSRIAVACVVGVSALGAALPSRAQAVRPPYARFAHGVDYSFKRIPTSIAGAAGAQPITLVSYVYTPLKNDRREAVLFSHGSTGGGTTAPGEPLVPARPVIEFFVTRGYTVVAPQRRGRGESGGTYGEECGVWSGACTMADETALFDSGLDQAIADSTAVLDQVVLGKLVPKDSKVLFAGVSRGGFLSLVLAARRPELAKGVISFVGGWFSVRDDYAAEMNDKRLKLQTDRLAAAAKTVRVPTLWIYAARDPFYGPVPTRAFFDAFISGGAKGNYVFVETHTLGSGHMVATDGSLWQQPADALLRELDPPAAPPSR
jgi:pimeloyl-ACP methyl ester carboxylesterase